MGTLEQLTTETSYATRLPLGVLDVVIVGAGFSGLGMAIKLLQLRLMHKRRSRVNGGQSRNTAAICRWRKRRLGRCGSLADAAVGIRMPGESPVIWPGSVVAYKRRTRAVAERDYILSSGAPKIRAGEQAG